MTLHDFFSRSNGTGILCTADAAGKVNAAVYSPPHICPDGTLAFLMRRRLTHANVSSNPSALYLFHCAGGGFSGVRIELIREREDSDPELTAAMTRPWLSPEEDKRLGEKVVVYFRVVKIRPLVGDSDPGVTC